MKQEIVTILSLHIKNMNILHSAWYDFLVHCQFRKIIVFSVQLMDILFWYESSNTIKSYLLLWSTFR